MCSTHYLFLEFCFEDLLLTVLRDFDCLIRLQYCNEYCVTRVEYGFFIIPRDALNLNNTSQNVCNQPRNQHRFLIAIVSEVFCWKFRQFNKQVDWDIKWLNSRRKKYKKTEMDIAKFLLQIQFSESRVKRARARYRLSS